MNSEAEEPVKETPPELQLPVVTSQDTYTPLGEGLTQLAYLEALLKTPKRVFMEIRDGNPKRVSLAMLQVCLLCLLGYGVVAGCFTGAAQLFWAPVKICIGVISTAILCFPSLYIFTSLSQVDIRLEQLAAYFLSALTLMALLLVGLCPVLFVFSVSTASVEFMGFMHLLFWILAGGVGAKALLRSFHDLRGRSSLYSVWWVVIFAVVLFQMSTTLRPLIGSSDQVFTSEKRFFLEHWLGTGW